MKRKILITDDNLGIQLLVSEFLKADYEMHMFSNGEEVLQYLNTGEIPDLIIADIQMPKINGWELLLHLKISLMFKDIPILILSAIEKSDEKIKFLEAGAIDYMIKPFSPEELKARVNNILKRNFHGTVN